MKNQTFLRVAMITILSLFLFNRTAYTQENEPHRKHMLSIGARINNINIDAINTIFSFPITFFWWNDSVPETNSSYGDRRFWLSNPFLQISPAFGKDGNSVQGRFGYIVLGTRGYPRAPNVYGYLFGDINYIAFDSEKGYFFPAVGIGIRSSDWTLFPGTLIKAKNLWLDLYVGYLISQKEFVIKHIKSEGWTFGLSIDYTFRW